MATSIVSLYWRFYLFLLQIRKIKDYFFIVIIGIKIVNCQNCQSRFPLFSCSVQTSLLSCLSCALIRLSITVKKKDLTRRFQDCNGQHREGCHEGNTNNYGDMVETGQEVINLLSERENESCVPRHHYLSAGTETSIKIFCTIQLFPFLAHSLSTCTIPSNCSHSKYI